MASTRTRAPRSPGAVPQQLSRWLNLAPGALDADAAPFVRALTALEAESHERDSIAGALLDLLDAEDFGRVRVDGRTVRSAVVETVLRLGYPWALHLRPEDLEHQRLESGRASPQVRRRRLTIAAVTLGVLASAAAALVALTLENRVVTHAAEPSMEQGRSRASIPQVAAAIVRVDALLNAGQRERAVAVAEACAVAFAEPDACVMRLSDIVSSRGAQVDQLRAQAWMRVLAENRPVREAGRQLFETPLARDASFLQPSTNPREGMAFVNFVATSLELERNGFVWTLQRRARDCLGAAAENQQLLMACRAALATAERQLPDLRGLSTEERATRGHLELMKEAFARGDLSLAVAEGEACLSLGGSAIEACAPRLRDALDRRFLEGRSAADFARRDELTRILQERLAAGSPER